MALYFFHGQEEFLMEKDIQKLKEKLLDKNFLAMNYKTFSNPNFLDLTDILGTPPMMFGNSLIIIECENYFDTKSESAFDDKQFKQLESALSNVPEQINIIFLCKIDRNLNKKVDTRKKIYKILAKYCEVREFKQLPAYDKTLPPLIIKLGKENGLELTSNCTSKIIEVLGSNLRIIDNELKKLSLFIYPNKQPNVKDIENICTTTQDIFKLVDYFVLSKKSEAMKEFTQLTQFQHPLSVLALLQSTISRFINLKLLSRNMNTFEISKQIGIHEYRVKLELEKISDYKYDDLLQLKNKIIDCEYKMKSGNKYTDETAVEQLLLSKIK